MPTFIVTVQATVESMHSVRVKAATSKAASTAAKRELAGSIPLPDEGDFVGETYDTVEVVELTSDPK